MKQQKTLQGLIQMASTGFLSEIPCDQKVRVYKEICISMISDDKKIFRSVRYRAVNFYKKGREIIVVPGKYVMSLTRNRL